MDNVLDVVMGLARVGGWLALAGGGWWLPVRLVIIGTGALVALTARDAIRAAHEHDMALLIEQLAAASQPRDAAPDSHLRSVQAR
jgi:hypothetical protein